MEILEHVHAIQPPHMISLIEFFIRRPDREPFYPNCVTSRTNSISITFADFVASSLNSTSAYIEGLAYIHKHRIAHVDIKPSDLFFFLNWKPSDLVSDDSFNQKIVDFDVVVQLEDENEEIGEYRGTKSWTAPEVGERDGSVVMWGCYSASG